MAKDKKIKVIGYGGLLHGVTRIEEQIKCCGCGRWVPRQEAVGFFGEACSELCYLDYAGLTLEEYYREQHPEEFDDED